MGKPLNYPTNIGVVPVGVNRIGMEAAKVADRQMSLGASDYATGNDDAAREIANSIRSLKEAPHDQG